MNGTVPGGDPPTSLLSRAIVSAAIRNSLTKLVPRVQFRNPVTLGVYVASIFTTIFGLATAVGAPDGARRAAFVLAIAAWLWLSVLLANFAESVAAEWGKARAATLRSMGRNLYAKRLLGTNRSEYRLVEAGTLRRGDLVLVVRHGADGP